MYPYIALYSLASQLTNPVQGDVEINCSLPEGGQTAFYAHTAVLAARSNYFQRGPLHIQGLP